MTEPKTVLGGGIVDIFKAFGSVAAFSAEIAPSRSFGRWDPASIVETRGGCEGTVLREGCEEGS